VNQDEFIRRLTHQWDSDQRGKPMLWFYICFDDDEEFRGAVFIQGHSFNEAVNVCIHREISAGGQPWGYECPEGQLPTEKWRNRLLTRAELCECTGNNPPVSIWEKLERKRKNNG